MDDFNYSQNNNSNGNDYKNNDAPPAPQPTDDSNQTRHYTQGFIDPDTIFNAPPAPQNNTPYSNGGFYAGASGTQGASGVSSEQGGTSGTQGVSGIQGASGFSGDSFTAPPAPQPTDDYNQTSHYTQGFADTDTIFTAPSTPQEKSYTPASNFSGVLPTYPGESTHRVPAVVTPMMLTQQEQKQTKKEKRTVSYGTVFVSSAATAIITSLIICIIFVSVSGGGFGLIFNGGSNGASSSTKNTSTPASTKETSSYATATTGETNPAAEAGTAIEWVSEKVGPSVVGIVVKTPVNGYYAYIYGQTETESQGSGIIYTADGYIITNYHVISDAVESNGQIEVYLASDLEIGIKATVVGYEASSDLAVIKIDKTGLTPIQITDSDNLKVGQTAIAVGNPGGLTFAGSVSSGIISGLNRTIQLENTTEMSLIQTDAAINPGNSGGALVDINGNLIGVNSAKLASSSFEGMGFAIPVNHVIEVVDRLIKGGGSSEGGQKAYVGLEFNSYYTAEMLEALGYPVGIVVSNAVEDGPAYNAGIKEYDIITQFNGVDVATAEEFRTELNKCKPGDAVTVTVYRSGQYYTAKVTLGAAGN